MIRARKGSKPLLERYGFHPLAPGQELQANIQQLTSGHGLGKSRCSTVLNMADYQLMMVEAPEVPQAELRAAIRWRIRDLIDFHIDDAVLDVFDSPASGARAVQEHLYVVVSKTSTVNERTELLQKAGVDLEIIDIPELALRNIAAGLEQDARGQALLYFEADRGLITLTRDGELFLARGMEVGYRQLQDQSVSVDRLALELQRSMDYYDRHFQQAPIATISLCPLIEPVPGLAEQLEEQTGITVKQFSVADIVEIAEPLSDTETARCLLAIGAALRTEPTQL
ncbi:MAG: hypothetical protein RQ736_05675 [Thiogranum sp.]|nr:hypothetical protein [Thiogranum sp.]